jgi:hypothetical protein
VACSFLEVEGEETTIAFYLIKVKNSCIQSNKTTAVCHVVKSTWQLIKQQFTGQVKLRESSLDKLLIKQHILLCHIVKRTLGS